MFNLALIYNPSETIHLNLHLDISKLAVEALLTEAFLTPKPGLVDANDSGSHKDMTLDHFIKSAHSLKDCFSQIAMVSSRMQISKELRNTIAKIGIEGEESMLCATEGINTHKGAIWALGLISSAAANLITEDRSLTIDDILENVSLLVSFDEIATNKELSTHGQQVKAKYQDIQNAHDAALEGFPILKHVAYPSFKRFCNEKNDIRLINVLIEIMSKLDDTCILYRSNIDVLREIQKLASCIIEAGGISTLEGQILFNNLQSYIDKHKVSPGGSADMLAATIFIDNLISHFN